MNNIHKGKDKEGRHKERKQQVTCKEIGSPSSFTLVCTCLSFQAFLCVEPVATKF